MATRALNAVKLIHQEVKRWRILRQNDTAKMEYRITQLDIEMKKIKGLLEEVVPEKGASHSKSLM